MWQIERNFCGKEGRKEEAHLYCFSFNCSYFHITFHGTLCVTIKDCSDVQS